MLTLPASNLISLAYTIACLVSTRLTAVAAGHTAGYSAYTSSASTTMNRLGTCWSPSLMPNNISYTIVLTLYRCLDVLRYPT
jgi:hypothetical protein